MTSCASCGYAKTPVGKTTCYQCGRPLETDNTSLGTSSAASAPVVNATPGRDVEEGAQISEIVAPAKKEIPIQHGLRSKVGRWKLIGAVVLALMVAAGAAMYALGGSGNEGLARDAVTKLATRDSSAASILSGPTSMADAAAQMGLIGVPASVTFSIDNLRTTPSASQDNEIQLATPAQYQGNGGVAGSSPAQTGETVSVSYTLKANATSGTIAQVDQTFTAYAGKGSDGNTHLFNVTVSKALVFDATAYFGTKGASVADANRVADDLRKGNAWIGGVAIAVTPTTQPATLPDVDVTDDSHLTTYTHTQQEAVAGTTTTWTVTVTRGTDDRAVVSVPAARAATKAAVAAKIVVGTVDPQAAIAGAKAALAAFSADLANADVAGLNANIAPGKRSIDTTGLAAMVRSNPATATDDAIKVDDSDGGITVTDGDFVIVHGSDGSWKIDAGQSRLVASELPGDGKSGKDKITGGLFDFGCQTATITVSLKGVEFYTNGAAATATFALTGTGDSGCFGGAGVGSVSVGWNGNTGGTAVAGTTAGAQSGQTVYGMVTLPDAVTPDLAPITFHVSSLNGVGVSWDASTK